MAGSVAHGVPCIATRTPRVHPHGAWPWCALCTHMGRGRGASLTRSHGHTVTQSHSHTVTRSAAHRPPGDALPLPLPRAGGEHDVGDDGRDRPNHLQRAPHQRPEVHAAGVREVLGLLLPVAPVDMGPDDAFVQPPRVLQAATNILISTVFEAGSQTQDSLPAKRPRW